MIIALDGPAGVGKSTLAKALAEKLGAFYLNSGAWYRAVTLSGLEAGLEVGDEEGHLRIAQCSRFEIRNGVLWYNGRKAGGELHTASVDARVAQVSASPPLRHLINQRIRQLSQTMDLVVEGRDMTTVAFPDAQHKFFIDASAEVRAQRRFQERPEGETYESILESIRQRDQIDRNKPVGALKVSPQAYYIDTSHLTFPEVYEKVVSIISTNISSGA